MQLLPSTAADTSVGIPDISTAENNIHAGAKYLRFLRDRYFCDEAIAPDARVDFTWAAYNAGPVRSGPCGPGRLKQGSIRTGGSTTSSGWPRHKQFTTSPTSISTTSPIISRNKEPGPAKRPGKPPGNPSRAEHHAASVRYSTQCGRCLRSPPSRAERSEPQT